MAAAKMTLDDIVVPERTVAVKPFNVSVSIQNDGPSRAVYLFGALYDAVPGKGPCGSATDMRFRAFTHAVQEAVEIPADSTLRYPPEGERWIHRYRTDDASPQPETAEFCVFIANATAGQLIDYEAFISTPLSVRAQNAAPVATFGWSPERPPAGADVTFRADATDAEGDPVAFSWDFGRFDAGGRSVGEGASAVSTFYPTGEYVVTLTATDGLDATVVARTIEVTAAAASTTPESGSEVPLSPWLAIGVFVILALRRQR